MITQQKASLLTHLNPLSLVRNVWHHKGLCIQFVRREIAQRYKGAYLGIFWSFLSPAVMLSAYTFVFSVVLKARWVGINNSASVGEFALTLFAGLIPFTLFSEVLNRSPGLILAVPNYVKKVVFPLEILPLVAVGSALVHSLISVGILLCANLILAKSISPTFILLPLAYLPLILFSLAVGWFFIVLGVISLIAGIPFFEPYKYLGIESIFMLATLFVFLGLILILNIRMRHVYKKSYKTDPVIYKTSPIFTIGSIGIVIIIVLLYYFFW